MKSHEIVKYMKKRQFFCNELSNFFKFLIGEGAKSLSPTVKKLLKTVAVPPPRLFETEAYFVIFIFHSLISIVHVLIVQDESFIMGVKILDMHETMSLTWSSVENRFRILVTPQRNLRSNNLVFERIEKAPCL